MNRPLAYAHVPDHVTLTVPGAELVTSTGTRGRRYALHTRAAVDHAAAAGAVLLGADQ